MQKTIGVFDSGVGGLSVIAEIKKLLPKQKIIFLKDSKNFPYGEKTPAEIRRIARENTAKLIAKKATIIVVACNTATVQAITSLRRRFPKVTFVGMEPAVKPAAKLARKGIIVLASPQALQSQQLERLIKKHASHLPVYQLGSLDLVKAVEENWPQEKLTKLFRKIFSKDILQKSDVVVLGCTHFPLVKNQLQTFLGKKYQIIDSGSAVAKRLFGLFYSNPV